MRSTRPSTSGHVTVHVELPKWGVSGSFSVPPGMHLGISVEGEDLVYEVSSIPSIRRTMFGDMSYRRAARSIGR